MDKISLNMVTRCRVKIYGGGEKHVECGCTILSVFVVVVFLFARFVSLCVPAAENSSISSQLSSAS